MRDKLHKSSLKSASGCVVGTSERVSVHVNGISNRGRDVKATTRRSLIQLEVVKSLLAE